MKKIHWLDKVISFIGDEPKKKKSKTEQFQEILNKTNDDGLLSLTEFNMIEGVLRLEQKTVGEVMIPSSDVHMVNYKDSLSKIVENVISTGHSRFPVIKIAGEANSIMGVLLVKDLFELFNKPDERKNFHVKKYLRKPLLVPEGKKLSELLFDFQQEKTHIAIVSDQFGLISGIVTIDNITTEILGQIADEHQKKKKPKIVRKNSGKFLVRANINLDQFNSFFKTNLSAEGVETLAGFALYKIGHIPKIGYEFSVADMNFKIQKATNRKIVAIEISTKSEPTEDLNG